LGEVTASGDKLAGGKHTSVSNASSCAPVERALAIGSEVFPVHVGVISKKN